MIDEIYQPKKIETSAQDDWDQQQTFKVVEDSNKEKFYCLAMFPYPSGRLHMGHVRNYTIGDVIARYQKMQNKNVLQPIGWDAFGLPAENAAIQHQRPAAEWTYENIAYMKKQLKSLGFGYDWSREIATCDPNYYRWEQWLFTKLFEKGLVYRKLSTVNWDPVDQTVLANEQVIDGRGWRSGALIERKEIPQWFLKITAYAEELLTDLEKLSGWPDQVRTMQRNWIGKSEGVNIHFKVADHPEDLTIYTTRPDTLMGVAFIAIAFEHPLAKWIASENAEVAHFIKQHAHTKVAEADLATQEKQGMDTGLTAIHPITKKAIPIWIANFVVMDYGSGAVMAVPAHDERDHEFAKKYHIPFEIVIQPKDDHDFAQSAYTADGTMIHSDQFNGLDSLTAKKAITEFLIKQKSGEAIVHYRLRDWGISRQRFWGAPIPMIYCDDCGTVPVPEKDLPVRLPEQVTLTGTTSPLKTMKEFYEVDCPKCRKKATRETDTFDTFMESSWYYARFACADQTEKMLDDRARYWTPVDFYIGGIEHAVLHLLYARFFHKVLRDEGLVFSDEPFTNLLTQGMVLKDGSKMSKSKGNTVDPEELIQQYGADTVRLFMMFAAPPELSLEWSDSGVEGAHRFLRRLWLFARDHQRHLNPSNEYLVEARAQLHQILQKALHDYQRCQFNTVVSSCMKLLNLLNDHVPDEPNSAQQNFAYETMSILLRLLAPITPHITHVLWRELKFGDQILDASPPIVDQDALKLDTINLVIQVNGKLRGQISVPSAADQNTIEALVKQHEDFNRWLQDTALKKIIVVPNKLVNIVVG